MTTTGLAPQPTDAGAPPGDGNGDGSLARHLVPLLLLGLAAALVSWWASHVIFPAYSWNRDEPVYLWHVALLRSGRLTSPDGGAAQFLWPWLSAHRGSTFFSQYTIGFPLLLLVAKQLGSPALALALGGALFVTGGYAFTYTLLRDRTVAILTGVLLLVSPILVVQGGVYLGYVLSAGLGVWFIAAFVHGTRTGRAPALVAAGALLGWIVLMRPFDAVLWFVAAAGPLMFWYWRERRVLWRAARWTALGIAPFLVLTLWYNHRLTGSFTTFPVNAKDPLDTYGFGLRRLMPAFDAEPYGIRDAVRGSLKNGFYFFYFIAGGLLAIPVALYGLWRARRVRSTLIVVALLVLFPLGYFMFWGTKVSAVTSRLSGPIYFVALYAPLCLLVASVVVLAWRARPIVGALLALGLVVAGAPIGIDRIAANRDISVAQKPWKRAADRLARDPRRSLVFVGESEPYAMLLDPYAVNAPDMNGQVLYATDLASRDVDLIESRPDRQPFRLQPSYRGDELGPSESPNTPQLGIVALRVERFAGSFTVHVTVTNPTDQPTVVAHMAVDKTVATRTLSRSSRRGARHELDWTVTTGDPGRDGSRARNAEGELTITVGFGSLTVFTPPSVRALVDYRLRNGTFAVLLPARTERRINHPIPGMSRNLQWRPALATPELDVQVG